MYQRQTFVDEQTVLSAEHLKHIEDGIVETERQITELSEEMFADLGNVNKSLEDFKDSTTTAMTNLGKSVADGKTLLATSISEYESVASDSSFEQLNTAMNNSFSKISETKYSEGYEEGMRIGSSKDAKVLFEYDMSLMDANTNETISVFHAFEDIPFKNNYIVTFKLDEEFHEERVIFNNLGFTDENSKTFMNGAGDKISFSQGTNPNSLHDFIVTFSAGSNPSNFFGNFTAYFMTWDNPINEKDSGYSV